VWLCVFSLAQIAAVVAQQTVISAGMHTQTKPNFLKLRDMIHPPPCGCQSIYALDCKLEICAALILLLWVMAHF